MPQQWGTVDDPSSVVLNAADVQSGAKTIKINWISGGQVTEAASLRVRIVQGSTKQVDAVLGGTGAPAIIVFPGGLDFLISDGDIQITGNSSSMENAYMVVDYKGV